MSNGKKIPFAALFMFAVFAVAIVFTGCARQEEDEDTTKARVYYISTDGMTLVSREFTPDLQNFEGILSEVLKEFEKPSNPELTSALPSSVSIKQTSMGVDNLTVDFDAGYLALNDSQRVLLQAALVKTLVYLPGVRYVSLMVDAQPITDMDGSVIGPLDEDSFVVSEGDGLL